MPIKILEDKDNKNDFTPIISKPQTKSLLIPVVIVVMIVGITMIGYFVFTLREKNNSNNKLAQTISDCRQTLSLYLQEFGTADTTCDISTPKLTDTWNLLEIQATTNDSISQINQISQPLKDQYQQLLYQTNNSFEAYIKQRELLTDLGYRGLPSLEHIEQELSKPNQPKHLVDKYDFYTKNTVSLKYKTDRYYILTQYKLDKFWDRVSVCEKLQVELPNEANTLITDFQLKKEQKAQDLIDLSTKESTQKAVELNDRLTDSIMSIIRLLYPKAKESKQNAKIIESSNTPKNTVNLPILMYHRIEDLRTIPEKNITDSRKSITISPEVFAWQLDFLQAKGYQTIDLNDLNKAISSNDTGFFDGKKIIISFDDGYPEHYNIAFKELQKRGMRGVFGVITSQIQDEKNSSKLNLSWQKLKEMQEGGMQIVSHSVSHCSLGSFRFMDGRTLSETGEYKKCDLNNLKEQNYGKIGFEMIPKKQAEYELIESKKIIEEKLDVKSPYLIYPYGAFNDQILDILWQSGYDIGLVVGGGPNINLNTPFTINRITVIGNTKMNETVGWFGLI